MFIPRQHTLWHSLGGGGDTSPPIPVIRRKVECVGPNFLSFCQPEPDPGAHSRAHAVADECPLQYHEDPDFSYLQRLNPIDWRKQDHYAVLGLKKLRHRATQDDVKKAYRSKMLIHHPDKRKDVIVRAEDDYFSCITRAWEVLGNPKTRRSYDSVDKTHDDSIPGNNSYNKERFYRVFGKAFQRNEHWSKIQPVPDLGGPASTREQVDQFYSFWYDFQSWREFSYLEEDDERDLSQEKKLRKNEVSRIRKLVNTAYALDPRIPVFKQEDRDRKAAVKQLRKEQARARLEEAAKKAEAEQAEARLEKERQEDDARELQEALKAERNARKRALKSSRTKLRKLVKANGYYVDNPEELVPHMMALEDIIEKTLFVDALEQLAQTLVKLKREAFLNAIENFNCNSSTTMSTSKDNGLALDSWTECELKLLAKAVQLYPSERKFRWELVADFVNQCPSKNAKSAEVVEVKWSEVQSSFPSEAAHTASADIDQDSKVTHTGDEAVADPQTEPAWTASELEALHTAKQTYPAFTPGRWDKIASAVGTRSRDECLKEAKRK